MRLALKLHPDLRCDAITGIDVEIERELADRLSLHFVGHGTMADLKLPATVGSRRADELWQHTCFEAFIRRQPGDGYAEFNFSPSSEWAAYQFDGYRKGMRNLAGIVQPRIETKMLPDRFELKTAIAFDPATPFSNVAWSVGLTAVIEEMSGRKSYWALAHPPGKPDFHHADCFALKLPAA